MLPGHTLSMSTHSITRQPAGQPTGGQFAEQAKACSGISLPAPDSGQEQYVHQGKTAAQRRQAAREARERSAQSWERSDTDGHLTQWAADTKAGEYDLQAEIADEGGTWQFPALMDTEGNLVPAKLINTRYGMAWGLLSDPQDPHSEFTGFVNPANASTPAKRAAAMAKKGYRIGTVRAPATTALTDEMMPHAYARRTDGGFNPEAQVVDDGTLTDSDDR